ACHLFIRMAHKEALSPLQNLLLHGIVELSYGLGRRSGKTRNRKVERSLRLFDDHEDILDQIKRKACQRNDELAFDRPWQRSGILRNEFRTVDEGRSSKGVKNDAGQPRVQHFL